MTFASRALGLALTLSASLALGGCGSADDSSIAVDVIGDSAAPFETGPRLSLAGQLARGASVEGLVAFDAEGRVVPALADRWIVTDEGQSYVFRLRDGSWPDGSTITGEGARDALRQAVAGLRGTALGLDLDPVSDIRAMAGRVVEIRLSRPVPDLLDILAQPEMGLTRRGKGTGPLRLSREGTLALLKPIPPEKRGMPKLSDWAERARQVRLHALPAKGAITRYVDGDVDIVLGGQLEDYPLALQAAGLSHRGLVLDPVRGLFGLAVTRGEGVLTSAEAREALAMAIDREALAADLGIQDWQPTTRILPVSADGAASTIGERWTSADMARRRAEAAARLARANGKGKAPLQWRIALPRGPGADLLFNRLSTDLKAVGVSLRRVGEAEAAELRLFDAVARYGGADWYFNQLACAAGRGLCSASADARVAEARAATDPARRAALLAEAEAELTAANSFIPLGSPLRWSLVRNLADGFAANARGYHPLSALAVKPK